MATICDISGASAKVKISYPLRWQYKVILTNGGNEKSAIDEVLKGEDYTLNFSKFSNGGKYMSFDVSVLVSSEEMRLEIFDRLKAISKFVL